MLPVLVAAMAAALAFSAIGTAAHGQSVTPECPDGAVLVPTLGQDQCVFECTSGVTALVVDENDRVEYHCLNNCDEYGLGDPIEGTCTGYGLLKYSTDGPDPQDDRTILFSHEGCPDILPFWNGTSCVAACPSGLADGITCVEQCPDGKTLQDGVFCVEQCPADKPLKLGSACTAECPDAAPYSNDGLCVDACPANKDTVVGGICSLPTTTTTDIDTDNLCYYRPGYGYATPEQQGITLKPGTVYVGAGVYGSADAGLLESAAMSDAHLRISLNDPTEKYNRYVVNICETHTGNWGSIGGIQSAADDIVFDKHGYFRGDNTAVRYGVGLDYDPNNTYWLYAVGMIYDNNGRVGDRVWLSPPQIVSLVDSTSTYSEADGASNNGNPQKQMQQQLPPQPQKQQQQQEQQPPQPQQQQQEQQPPQPQQQEQQQQEQDIPGNSNDDALRQNLEERIQRLDYRIGMALELLDQTKPHQEKRIEKLNNLIDKLMDRKAILQERLDGLS